MEKEVKDFLEHFGVMGMHWGIRNKSLPSISTTSSPAGRGRYTKSAKSLSDDELKRRINRLDMEKRYKSLNRSVVSKGSGFASSFLVQNGKNIAGRVVSGISVFLIKIQLEKKFAGLKGINL